MFVQREKKVPLLTTAFHRNGWAISNSSVASAALSKYTHSEKLEVESKRMEERLKELRDFQAAQIERIT
jgi:hypothetical protein